MRFVALSLVVGACSFQASVPPKQNDPDAIAIDSSEQGMEVATSSCMASYNVTHGTSRYRVATGSWYEAVTACEQDGGHLVVIDDAAENAFVLGFDPADTSIDVWLGMSDHQQEDTFRWITNVVVPQSGTSTYQNWQGGQPNDASGVEDCGEMNAGGVWNDMECGFSQTYVCECDGKAPATPPTWCRTGTSQHCDSCNDNCLTCDFITQICL